MRSFVADLVWLVGFCLLALVLQNGCRPAYADIPAAPGDPNYAMARFPTGATAVTVDVVEVGGLQIANDVAATRLQADATNTDAWFLDLSTLPGYPVNCAPRTYFTRWNPDGADCSTSGTPDSCVEQTFKVGGPLCKADPRIQVSIERTLTAISGQGITQQVLSFFLRKSEDVIRWRRVDVAPDLDFSSPAHTYWLVYFYGTSGNYPHLWCEVYTETDPAVTLPSSADCTGS